jgi:hypothetical protein
MKNLKQLYVGALAVILLIGGSIAFTGCNKENDTRGRNGSNVTGTNEATSTDFFADLLVFNEPFSDDENDIEGYAWEWEIQRKAGQTGLSHFNFLDGFLCKEDEDAGTLREHIIGAYYSQDGGSTWNYVPVVWAEDGSTSGKGGNEACYTGEVLKINFGGDNIQIRLVLDEEYDKGTQYALYKRGVGGKNNAFAHCGIIEFVGPGCPIDPPVQKCWDNETAWADGDSYGGGNWATYTEYVEDATVTLYAGQSNNAGSVHFSAADEFGFITITITLANGWEFQDVNETVKIQGYNSAPSGNPAPGNFINKCNSCTSIKVPATNYYGIHLDVRKEKNCN